MKTFICENCEKEIEGLPFVVFNETRYQNLPLYCCSKECKNTIQKHVNNCKEAFRITFEDILKEVTK